MFRRNARYRTPLGVRCNERAERTRREGGGEKRGASDCVTRSLLLLLLFHSWAFTEGKTRIEDPPRTSGILMKFLPLPSAKGKGEREREKNLSFSWKRFTERALIPSAGCIPRWTVENRRLCNGEGVCSTQFSSDANHICLLFRGGEKERRRLRGSGK